MARPEGLKSEARRVERVGSWGGDVPLLPARGSGEHCSKLSQGVQGKVAQRPGDLEHVIGLQSRSWC